MPTSRLSYKTCDHLFDARGGRRLSRQQNQDERLAKEENAELNNADPNQYCHIDVRGLRKLQAKQKRVGESIGTCMEENATLHTELVVTEPHLQPKLIRMTYNRIMPSACSGVVRPVGGTQHHIYVLLKINNVWYVRDKSNCVDCQMELNNWVLRRIQAGAMPCEFYEVPWKLLEDDGKSVTTSYDRGNLKAFDYSKYHKHNRIVLRMRGEWDGDHIRCKVPDSRLP